ncbi:MAG: putative metal-dependent enzyme (double-stranded beta helix superfamily) [Hyphomicrobiaceae bacterium]|jgi:predicted metal-dependent enzyme (double-stranded beta helix superfamily)
MAVDTQSYTLDALTNDIRAALAASSGADGQNKVASLVSRALLDKAFIAEHLKDRAPGEHPREVLFEDDDTGFCICGHVYAGEAIGEPHDHGSSWAIYGQAVGETEMTDWRIAERGNDDKPHLVEAVKTYTMVPGDAHVYAVGDVHSPSRVKPVKLIRIEGANLDHVQRSNIAKK